MVPTYQVGYARNAAESAWPQLWNGLVFSWCPLLGNTGNRAIDQSGRSNHGTWSGTGNHWKASGGRGGAGLAGYFDKATSDYVTFPSPVVKDSTSISVWVALWDVLLNYSTNGFLSCGNIATDGTPYLLLQYDQTSGMRTYSESNGYATIISSVPVDAWVHLCVVRAGGTEKVYLDGVLKVDRACGTIGNNTNLYAGIGYAYVAYVRLDDLLVYNRGLTQGEVQLLSRRRGIAFELAETMQTAELAAALVYPTVPYHSINIFDSFIRRR